MDLSAAAFCHALTPSLPTVPTLTSLGFDLRVASTISLYAYSSNSSSCCVALFWQTSTNDLAIVSGEDCNCKDTSALHVYWSVSRRVTWPCKWPYGQVWVARALLEQFVDVRERELGLRILPPSFRQFVPVKSHLGRSQMSVLRADAGTKCKREKRLDSPHRRVGLVRAHPTMHLPLRGIRDNKRHVCDNQRHKIAKKD